VPQHAPVIAIAWAKPDYLRALELAGASIRELEPQSPDLTRALDAVDGVLLTGGVDVAPQWYGDPAVHPTVEIDPLRDTVELALARAALERDLPTLAICRGEQVLNVAAGGTLIQDIPSTHPEALPHRVVHAKNALAHDITVAAGSHLERLLQPRLADHRLPVNSRHHQAVRDVAPSFVVSATAPDGIIEAIEKPDAAFCVGVQWHPENFWETGEFAALFEGLVAAARRRRPAHQD
jgi:putative glutamine amidotransferase